MRPWSYRVLEPNDLVTMAIKDLRHLQATGHGKVVCPHADRIEGVLEELAGRFIDLRNEVDSGVYDKGNWPVRRL